jgi:Na+/proline symporter
MLSAPLVIGTSFAYLLLLFAVAYWGDARAAAGRSVIGSPWVYALLMAVYCTAWTYFGSVGRAASSGVWFLPIYLGPMLAMVLAWMVVRKMIRIAKTYRITSIADFIASRYGKSPTLAGLVTLITVVGIVPYIALQLKGIASGYAVLTSPLGQPAGQSPQWWLDSTLYVALALAGFTMVFGARHLDSSERHEGMVAAIAFESVVKLVAFLSVGLFVSFGLFSSPAALFEQAHAVDGLRRLMQFGQGQPFAYAQWLGLTLLAMLSVIFLPRQFQVMVVENVNEDHLRRAAWAFPLYLFLINLFVLPIAIGGLLHFGPAAMNPETFVLSLPLSQGHHMLALFAFVGGISAATGMVIVEAIAVSTMVCNDLVMPWLLRMRRFGARASGDLTGLLLTIRRLAILGILLLGYLYFHLAGEAYALVSIGLISFAAVAQFAPAMLGGMYWKGGTRRGALSGLLLGFAFWVYCLMLPSLAKSGWLNADFLNHGPWGIVWFKPEAFLGLSGLDSLTHALFWSLLANIGAYVGVSLWRAPSARETSQALLFVDVFHRKADRRPVFWQGRAKVSALLPLAGRFLGPELAQRQFELYAVRVGVASVAQIPADAELVQFVETLLTGAIGSASARVMVGRGGAGPGRRDAHPGRGLPAAHLCARAGGQVAVAGARHRRVARSQRQAQEPGPAQGRFHVLGHARIAHAFDIDQSLVRTHARRCGHGVVTAAAVSGHCGERDRAPEPAGEPGAGHGQDRVRPGRMAQRAGGHARAAGAGRQQHGRDLPRSRGCVAVAAAPGGAAAAGRCRPHHPGGAQPLVQCREVRTAQQRAGGAEPSGRAAGRVG